MSVSTRQHAYCDKLSNLIFHSSEEEDSVDDKQSVLRVVKGRAQLIHSHHSHPSLLQQSIMRVQQPEDEYLPIVVKRNNFLQEKRSPPKDVLSLAFRTPPLILFVDSDEEQITQPQPYRKPQTQPQIQLSLQQHPQSPQLLPQPQSLEEQESSVEQDESIPLSHPKPQGQGDGEDGEDGEDGRDGDCSVLHVGQSARQRGGYFLEVLQRTQDYQGITGLMFEPLLQRTVQIFQVHVYSSLTEKSFELWMDSLPNMRLIMRATKSVRPQRTTYEINNYLEHCRQFCQTCTLSSNLDRSEFAVEAGRGNTPLLLATIACGTTLQSSKNIVLYYPTIDPHTQRPRTLTASSLKLLFQDQQEPFVDYLATARVPIEERQRLMQQHSLRPSAKSMEFRGRDGDVRLVMGKKGSKRYCLITGAPLTPIQAFALAIVNIETS